MQITSEPWHAGIYHQNKTLYWMPSDTQEIFEESLKDPAKHKYLEQQGWLDRLAIQYKINSNGFRCDEFESDSDCLVALGCSFTVGIGLPENQTWPWLLGQFLNLKVYNLAWGGNSADACFRMAQYWIPKLKPRLVCMLTPPAGRIELLTASGPWPPAENILPTNNTIIPDLNNSVYLKHWFGNSLNSQVNIDKNKLAVEMIAKNNNADYIVFDVDSEESTRPHLYGYARDFLHVSGKGQSNLANKMLEHHE